MGEPGEDDTLLGSEDLLIEPVSLNDPESIDHDIYDEFENLMRLQDLLTESLASNEITQEDYDNEMLKARYYLDINTKSYDIDDDDKVIIDKLREYKDSLIENFKNSDITEEYFNQEFVKILRKEYEILKLNEAQIIDKPKEIDVDEPLEEKLKKLHETEVKYNRKIAKQYGIDYPKIPRGITEQQIDEYHDIKTSRQTPMNFLENPIIEEYLSKLREANKLVTYYTSSFEISKLVYDSELEKGVYNYKMVIPSYKKIKELVEIERRSELLTPSEKLYNERIINIKNKLRGLERNQLLDCIGERTFKLMSYIERLRENKRPVLKFVTGPKETLKLRELLDQDVAKYYKIDSVKLFNDFMSTRPDINSTDSTDYLEKGNVFYEAIVNNSRDLKEQDFVTVKPLSDDLYNELKTNQGDYTEVVEMWTLDRVLLPGQESGPRFLSKRYLSFEDYLSDLKEVLLENSKKVSGKPRDVLLNRIRKISYYLEYNEDLEVIAPNGNLSVSDLFEKRSQIYTLRREGTYKLLEYITAYYPQSQILVERIEADIFNFSSEKYNENVDKVIFILKNYQNKLEDLIEKNESIMLLLNYETPRVLPEDDIDLDDKEGTIDKIVNQWKPYSTEYDYYSGELENSNHNFTLFKTNHPELSTLQIQDIMNQYAEKKQWERSLVKFQSIEIPDGSIEINYRLRFLLRLRNRLPSRRIYTVASIKERIETQKTINAVFRQCNFSDPNKYTILGENIVFGLSKFPEDYQYYIELIKGEFRKLCEHLEDSNLINIEMIPIIIEFLVKEGEISNADITRLRELFTRSDESFKNYLLSLRGDIADVYVSVVPTVERATVFSKVINILKNINRENRFLKLRTLVNNTYKPPIISFTKPVKIRMGIEFDIQHIKIGDTYVYGGYYPMYNSYDEVGNVTRVNYTRDDLEQLAIILNLDILEDSEELYLSIMDFIRDYNKNEYIPTPINFNPIEYNTYYEYLKTPVNTISYTVRPRLGVPEPGEAYLVTKSEDKIFGVPFRLDENKIPVYSLSLKEAVDNSFIIIEGPCIFEETSEYNKLTSDYYIEIQYKDDRGKTKIFREGVPKKKIIKRKLDDANTCSRFLTQESCDGVNSYSLEIKKLKLKCKWIENKCFGVTIQEDLINSFNMEAVKFKKFENNKSWEEAKKRSLTYIENVVKLNAVSLKDLEMIIKDQKQRLYNYYIVLLEKDSETKRLKTIAEEPTYDISYSNLGEIKPGRTIKVKKENEDYMNYTVYKQESTRVKRTIPKIIIDNTYIVDDEKVIPKVLNEDGTYLVSVVETGEEKILSRTDFRIVSDSLQIVNIPVFCYVKKEDSRLLFDLKSYKWTLVSTDIEEVSDKLIRKQTDTIKNFVPANFIYPTGDLNGSPLITREDILNAMAKTAYCKLETDDNIVYKMIYSPQIHEEAVKFAVKNDIDLTNLLSYVPGRINLSHVLEEYNKIRPVSEVISKSELLRIITEAVENEDIETLKKYYVRGRKQKLDRELMKSARELINTKKEEPEPNEEPNEEPEPKEEPKKPVKSIYTASRRR